MAALLADTTPSEITAGQFAIVDTGNVDDPDNSKLYLWNGSVYTFVTDLSGAQGIKGETGFTGSIGFTGSTGLTGFDGSKGDLGYTGSQGERGYTGSSTNLTVSLINPQDEYSNVVLDVNAIRFDTDSGFDVFDLGNGEVKIGMNSTFKFWEVDGQDTLEAIGLDTIKIIAGPNMIITTDAASDPKSITFSAIAYTGSRGFTGSTGFAGSQGNAGFTGSIGFTGSQGIPGEFAAIGFTGSQGITGFTGSIGSAGFTGSRGGIGFTGSIGFSGSTGFTGSKGDPGTSVKITGFASTAANLPIPYTGDIGDGYLTQDDGHLHVWTGTSWIDVGEIRGPKGDTGFTGSGGSGFIGSGDIVLGGSPNLDGGYPFTNYGGINAINGGGVSI